MTINLQPLDKKLRNKLERTVKQARDVAEEGARAACRQLGVGRAKADDHLSDEEKDLRRRLRIHGRQLGDKRDPKKETQEVDRLVDEIAYEHWHRMLFARFLAENGLLMYPDPDDPVSVSIEDCEELAADEGAKNGWELAARFAARMLPQIFRLESPVFSLDLPPENQQQLERLLSDLPEEVFTASDSLGWVYQFWQAKRKDEVNASEVKIGARELPAVTQLFTEPYMVSFLLDNSLGAWWAARRLTEEDLANAKSEQELRDKASLPGAPLEYLRFIREPTALAAGDVSGNALAVGSAEATPPGDAPETSACGSGPWRPAAGTFDSWPESLSELKTLDPCCGSGHFLVAALLMLIPMRMELEGLSAREAVDLVLSENLHGLEIDQRCVELAAFALALTAWRYPDAGGYRPLPDLNVACCGLSVSVAKEEWKSLAKDNNQLRIALDWMYDEFKNAPFLGSLLNPAESMASKVVRWEELAPTLADALTHERSEEQREISVVAHGLARTSLLLATHFDWVITNVPYLGRSKQSDQLKRFIDDNFPEAVQDIGSVFLARIVDLLSDHGVFCVVTPQNWSFLKTYLGLRERIFNRLRPTHLAELGAGAFETPLYDFSFLLSILLNGDSKSQESYTAVVASDMKGPHAKAAALPVTEVGLLRFDAVEKMKDKRLLTKNVDTTNPLSEICDVYCGIQTGDNDRFVRKYWETARRLPDWEFYQRTPDVSMHFAGMEQVLFWEGGSGVMSELPGFRDRLSDRLAAALDKAGVGFVVHRMGKLPSAMAQARLFDQNGAVLIPRSSSDAAEIWRFVSSSEYHNLVRSFDNKVGVTPTTLTRPSFSISDELDDGYGLPEPYSDDPTQWVFHGHPASAKDALQVACARLLGYRWPAELDEEMELATDALAWVERSGKLTDLADGDGIVCIPAVGTEQPAEDRLLNLLHKAYEAGREVEQQFQEKLDAGDTDDALTLDLLRRGWQPSLPGSFNDWLSGLLEAAGHKDKTLDSWLREKFFAQHCKLFHNRPFVWHIWDGLKDGFSVLVNYHKLDNRLLKTLIYTYLNDWIVRQRRDRDTGVDGSEEKLAAAEWLKQHLELILEGQSPHDIFVRWKPLDQQPIGWNPDINDGVRLNVRPWMTVGDVKKKGAGILRDKPNIHWKKDRGKDVESAPWYTLGLQYGGKEDDRINDHHLTLAEKKAAKKQMEAES